MPRFFFDITDSHDFPDAQGAEFPDLEAARLESVRYAAEILGEMPEQFWNCEEWMMTVRDRNRKPLFKLKVLAEPMTVDSAAA